jgi:hypothetical protein
MGGSAIGASQRVLWPSDILVHMASAERRRATRPKVHYVVDDREFSGDLVFQDSRPLLVVSWRTVDGKRVPYVSFPLESDKLRSRGPADYIYEGDLGR